MKYHFDKILLLAAAAIIWGIYYTDRKNLREIRIKKLPLFKNVHFWNRPNWISKHIFKGCPYKCTMTEGTKIPEDSDAVIFHTPYLHLMEPPSKPKGQIWIFQGQEPPTNYMLSFRKWRNLFNWTMTYRRDSDIFQPYAVFDKYPKFNKRDDFKEWFRKSKTAAWFVGHCRTQSRREEFVKLIKKYLNVEIYGSCGYKTCKRRGGDEKCLQMLDKWYVFYLSFESALCRDYVTEKLFKVFTKTSVIPVVRGNAIYEMIAPPHSYIDTSDFRSTSALGKYLTSVSLDEGNFSSYFKSRVNFMVNSNINAKSFCDLCRRVHTPSAYRRLYDNIEEWLYGSDNNTVCRPPQDLE